MGSPRGGLSARRRGLNGDRASPPRRARSELSVVPTGGEYPPHPAWEQPTVSREPAEVDPPSPERREIIVAMKPRGLLRRPKLQPGAGAKRATPKQARRALARTLALHEKRLATNSEGATEVQLLGQLSSASDWSALRAHWERRVGAHTASWPRTLPIETRALNLWPIKPGRVGPPAGMKGDVRKRQPTQLLSTPALAQFTPMRTSATLVLCGLCAAWLEDVGMEQFAALRIAPPILEDWAPGGRLLSREVVDFGLSWSLPAADYSRVSAHR